MALDEKVRGVLRELGAALNEAISSSSQVHELLGRIREEGYDPYLVLDATVGLDRRGKRATARISSIRKGGATARKDDDDAPFTIDVRDLKLLRSLGIDPTRPVRSRKRPEATVSLRSTVSKRS